MKCPKCQRNHRRKREGMRCTCGYSFRLDPQVTMPDSRFLALLKKASAGDTQRYTVRNLIAVHRSQLLQEASKNRKGCLGCSGVLALGSLLVAASGEPGALVVTLVGVLGSGVALLNKPPDAEAQVLSAVEAWRKAGGELPGMLEEPSLHTPPPEAPEPDVFDYGVERVLVVDRDLLVDLFVLNGFHAQERALVISAGGYPQYLVPRLAQVLEQNPETPVYLLHDAGSVISTAHLPEGARVIDLGFTSQQSPPPYHRVDDRPYQQLAGMVSSAMKEEKDFSTLVVAAAAGGAAWSFDMDGDFG